MTDLTRHLSRLSVSPTALERASESFRQAADAARLLDLAYDVVDSPLGRLMVTCSYAGVARIDFAEGREDEVLELISGHISPRLMKVPERTRQVRNELDEYFRGKRKAFEVPVDLTSVRGFRQKVLEATARIPYGGSASYTAVATAAGNARAVRATGTALGHNPVPIIVPCHRVLRSDGTLGGYGGGLFRKEILLDLEASTA